MPLWNAAVFTVSQAFCSMLFALLLGIPAGYLAAKRRFPFRNALLSLSAVPFCMPPLLIALGFVLFYGRQGILNRFVLPAFSPSSQPLVFLYSFWGIVFTHGLYNFPLVMRMCSDAWQQLPPDQGHAALLMGASPFRIFRTITIFQLAPALGAASLLVFLYCFFSFVIVLLFGSIGGSTLEVELYQSFRGTLHIKRGIIAAVIETSTALAVVCLYMLAEKKAAVNTGILPAAHSQRSGFTTKMGAACATVFLLCIVFFFCGPLFALAVRPFYDRSFFELFTRLSFLTAVKNTVFVGLATAFCATLCGSLYAFAVRLADPYKKKPMLRVLPMLPLAVSSIVAGFLFMLLFRVGSPLALIVCQTFLIFPLAYRQAAAGADRIPQEVLEAAAVNSVRRSQIFFRVFLPLCKPAVITAFSFSFAVSAGDASLPLLLAIPRFDTLSLYVYRLAGAYRFSQACAAGFTLALLAGGVFFLGLKKGKSTLIP